MCIIVIVHAGCNFRNDESVDDMNKFLTSFKILKEYSRSVRGQVRGPHMREI